MKCFVSLQTCGLWLSQRFVLLRCLCLSLTGFLLQLHGHQSSELNTGIPASTSPQPLAALSVMDGFRSNYYLTADLSDLHFVPLPEHTSSALLCGQLAASDCACVLFFLLFLITPKMKPCDPLTHKLLRGHVMILLFLFPRIFSLESYNLVRTHICVHACVELPQCPLVDLV